MPSPQHRYKGCFSGSAVDDAEGGQCLWTYTNGAQQDCYAAWAFRDVTAGRYDVWVRIPRVNSPNVPVAPASIRYNIYHQGGPSGGALQSNLVNQRTEQGTWKLIRSNVNITPPSTDEEPVRVTLSDAWFRRLQYTLLIDAVRLCPR